MAQQEYSSQQGQVEAPASVEASERIRAIRTGAGWAPLWRALRGSGRALVQDLVAITEIPAPTFSEHARGAFVAHELEARTGQPAQQDELGNRWVECPGAADGPTILVCAHLDTVFEQDVKVTVRRQDGRLYAPGIGDNGSGQAVLLQMARVLTASRVALPGTLILAANVREEGLGNLDGVRALCERFRGRLAGVLALDGCLGNIVGSAVGSVRYRVRVEGPGGHSWADFGRPSALHFLCEVAARLTRLKVPSQPRTTFNLGNLHGGTTVNTIASEASLLLDLRSVDSACLASLDVQARQAIHGIHPPEGLKLTVDHLGERPTGPTNLAKPWVDLARAAWTALDIPVKVTAGSTDANVPLSMWIPASTLGVCRGGGTHTLDEWLEPGSLSVGLEAALLTVLAALHALPPVR
jgi:tripeptide aminopeptidase